MSLFVFLDRMIFHSRKFRPENILIGENGYLKVADFGFAKQVAGRTYTLCGTPDYLSVSTIIFSVRERERTKNHK